MGSEVQAVRCLAAAPSSLRTSLVGWKWAGWVMLLFGDEGFYRKNAKRKEDAERSCP